MSDIYHMLVITAGGRSPISSSAAVVPSLIAPTSELDGLVSVDLRFSFFCSNAEELIIEVSLQ